MPQINTAHNGTQQIDEFPDTCPICHMSGEMKSIMAHDFPRVQPDKLHILMQCQRNACTSTFLAQYRWDFLRTGQSYHDGHYCYRLVRCAPRTTKTYSVATEITAMSPRFQEIANQALEAETLGLSDLAGMGYRKGLEFLIKDFCIRNNPTKKDEILKLQLGGCISGYVKDANVQACARRAAWIGNDETHYLRVWGKHDVQDLKALLQLTQAWILNELLTQKYLEELPEKK